MMVGFQHLLELFSDCKGNAKHENGFGYFGTPEVYKIVIINKDTGEVKISKKIVRKEFNSEGSLLEEVKKHFIELELKNGYDNNEIYIYNYKKPEKKLNTLEFYGHCQNGIIVKRG